MSTIHGVKIPKIVEHEVGLNKIRISNALIRSIDITLDRGSFLCCWVFCDWGGSACGFGGYPLDAYDPEAKDRAGCEFGARYLRELICVLGTESFKKAERSVVRIAHGGLGESIYGIGHAIDDRWFWPRDLACRMGLVEVPDRGESQ